MIIATVRKLFQASPKRRPGITFRPQVEGLEGRWVPANLNVPAQYATIQAAVNAANPGDNIVLANGTYTQDAVISRNSAGVQLNNLHIMGQTSNRVIIEAPAGISSTGAVLDINGPTGVLVQNLVVDGNGQVFDAGIRVIGGASAQIQQVTVQNTFNNGQNQLGFGIRVGDNGALLGTPTTGSATLQNLKILNYNKGGIIVDGTGSHATVQNNIVTGSTTNPNGLLTVSQNGIQVSNGASGQVQNNTITNSYFDFSADTVALGIEIFNTTVATTVTNNTLTNDESAIEAQQSSNVQIQNNRITNTAFDGIILTNSSNNVVQNNQVSGVGSQSPDSTVTGDAITVQGSSYNTVANNQVMNNTGSGLYVGPFGNNNSNYNTIINNQMQGNGLDGITLQNASNNTLSNNQTNMDGQNGIADHDGSYNTITQCQAQNNGGYGFALYGATNDTISYSLAQNNALGNFFQDSATTGTVLNDNQF